MKLLPLLSCSLIALASATSIAQSNQYDENFWAGKLGLMQTPSEQLEEGLLPFYPDHYQFSEGGTGIKYEQTSPDFSFPKPYKYEVDIDSNLHISDITLVSNFQFFDNLIGRVGSVWGNEVWLEMQRMDQVCRFYSSGQWEVQSGISNELIEVLEESDGRLQVQITQTFSEVLIVPVELINNPDCGWRLDETPTYTEVREPIVKEYNFESRSLFEALEREDFLGNWSLPISYFIPNGEDLFQARGPSINQDYVTFTLQLAQAKNSDKTFNWSLDNGVLILENDEERYEYKAKSSVGNYYSISVKYFKSGDLSRLLSSEMARFAEVSPDAEQVYSFIQQDYPMVMGATIGERNAEAYFNGLTMCPDYFYFGFAFLPDGRVAPRSRCAFGFYFTSNENEYSFLMPSDDDTYEYDSETFTLEVSLYNLEKRIWQIVDILNERDLLVMESRINNRDDNRNGEFDDSEIRYITQPRLQIYRKMDLSQNTEAWQNTDSDADGLSNAKETELGTDIINADTDGDGVPDGEEVANGTNPLRDENVRFTAFDYDGDGKADVAVRRPSNSMQYVLNSSDEDIQRVKFGLQDGDIPVSGDFDGDGIADVAVRRPSNYTWYVLNSSDGEIQRIRFGLQESDIPVPADYDGDGITDVAVRRSANQMWYILNSSDGEIQRIQFGLQEADIPVPADYDGDGKADVAVRRPSNQMWYILNSSDGEIQRIKFGLQEADIPVPADYDGDGKADVAVRRPSNQMWYILNSSDGEIQRIRFGLQESDIPVVADYDGDQKADVAVRRAPNQFQYILRSSDDMIERIQFGRQSTDIPIAAPVSIRLQMLQDIEDASTQNNLTIEPELKMRDLVKPGNY